MCYVQSMHNDTSAKNWIPDVSTFGARLALVRWRMGWNMKEAERECNITQNAWSKWEDGALPRNYVEIVNRVVLRTGVDKMWLMTGEGSPEPNRELVDYKATGPLAPVTPIRRGQSIAS